MNVKNILTLLVFPGATLVKFSGPTILVLVILKLTEVIHNDWIVYNPFKLGVVSTPLFMILGGLAWVLFVLALSIGIANIYSRIKKRD